MIHLAHSSKTHNCPSKLIWASKRPNTLLCTCCTFSRSIKQVASHNCSAISIYARSSRGLPRLLISATQSLVEERTLVTNSSNLSLRNLSNFLKLLHPCNSIYPLGYLAQQSILITMLKHSMDIHTQPKLTLAQTVAGIQGSESQEYQLTDEILAVSLVKLTINILKFEKMTNRITINLYKKIE